MKRLTYLMMITVFSLSFFSCSDDEWEKDNEDAFNKIKSNPDYTRLEVDGGSIYYKVIESGMGEVNPGKTNKVRVRYTGSFYDGEVFDSSGTSAREFVVSELIVGFSVALQNMVVGDKWEVWIPYYFGYGTEKVGSIPGYSTLIFEIELLSIVGK